MKLSIHNKRYKTLTPQNPSPPYRIDIDPQTQKQKPPNLNSTQMGPEPGMAAARDLYSLPEGCIANALSLTSPVDASRLAAVSSLFRSAAESDAVWERFLPPDCAEIAVDLAAACGGCASKKELFLRLCDEPVLIDGGTKSFSLDKRTGKKRYFLSARDLCIVWGDSPRYWKWTPTPESKFPEVAELVNVCWLEIRGRMTVSALSPSTTYAAYFVFKSTAGAYGFEYQPVEVSAGVAGREGKKGTAFLDGERRRRQRYRIIPRRLGPFNRGRILGVQANLPMENESQYVPGKDEGQYPRERGDGWLEVELGEFFNDGGGDGEVEMCVSEMKGGDWKGGIVVYGIELRPKEGK